MGSRARRLRRSLPPGWRRVVAEDGSSFLSSGFRPAGELPPGATTITFAEDAVVRVPQHDVVTLARENVRVVGEEYARMRSDYPDGDEEEPDGETVKRPPGCLCQWEWGDSPCPVHGDDEGEGDPNAEGEPSQEEVLAMMAPKSSVEDALVRGLDAIRLPPTETIVLRPQRDRDGLFVVLEGIKFYLHGEHLSEETEVRVRP